MSDLFGTPETNKFLEFKIALKQKIIRSSPISNEEIVEYTIQKKFLPKHAKEALKDIINADNFRVEHDGEVITSKPNKWNIAEEIKKSIIFTYEQ
jgi:hypothetical protein